MRERQVRGITMRRGRRGRRGRSCVPGEGGVAGGTQSLPPLTPGVGARPSRRYQEVMLRSKISTKNLSTLLFTVVNTTKEILKSIEQITDYRIN